MLRKALQTTTRLHFQPRFNMINPKRKPFAKDLDKYEIVIVGGNLGGILSSHLDAIFHGHHSIMVCFDQYLNQQFPIRCIYEQQRASKQDYSPNAKMGINMYMAHSECIGIESFDPSHSKFTLRNGRTIGYDHMVVAMGLKDNTESVKGLYEAWADVEHPVFMPKDLVGWKAEDMKHPRYIYNYTHGDAFFYIPPYPLSGELEGHNYFIAEEIWRWGKFHGRVSPKSSFTVVNANDTFIKYQPEADEFIKSELVRRGVNVVMNTKLNEIKKDGQKAIFTDLKSNSVYEKGYSNFYSLIPMTHHESLVQAGLASKQSNNLLDVDIHTLRHNKYKNIFGLGDVCNLPTTKSFWGGFYQLHVVRENLTSAIKGKQLNASYDGYSKVPLIIGQTRLTYVVHYYDMKPGALNLFDKGGSPLSYLRYYYWGKNMKKKFIQFYLFKNWGPPFYKFKKRFGKTPVDPNEVVEAPKIAHH